MLKTWSVWVMSVGWVKPAERQHHLIREEIFKNEVKLVNLLFCDVNQSTSVERQNWWWRHVDHVTSAFCWHFCTLKHWRWITKWDRVKNRVTFVQYLMWLLCFSRCLTLQLLYQRNMLHLGGRRPPDPKNWPVRPDGVTLARCDPHRDPSVAPQCLLEAPSTPPPPSHNCPFSASLLVIIFMSHFQRSTLIELWPSDMFYSTFEICVLIAAKIRTSVNSRKYI